MWCKEQLATKRSQEKGWRIVFQEERGIESRSQQQFVRNLPVKEGLLLVKNNFLSYFRIEID